MSFDPPFIDGDLGNGHVPSIANRCVSEVAGSVQQTELSEVAKNNDDQEVCPLLEAVMKSRKE
jgi:hypothetical protein